MDVQLLGLRDVRWEALLADGGQEVQCGWLTDRFGVSWQIVPEGFFELLTSEDQEAVGRAYASGVGVEQAAQGEQAVAGGDDVVGVVFLDHALDRLGAGVRGLFTHQGRAGAQGRGGPGLHGGDGDQAARYEEGLQSLIPMCAEPRRTDLWRSQPGPAWTSPANASGLAVTPRPLTWARVVPAPSSPGEEAC